MGRYNHAQICLNGHVITSNTGYSELTKKYCPECGELTITNCPKCNALIKGDYYVEGVIGFSQYHAPAFCDNCGNAYPWTESSQKAAYELIHFSDTLTLEEKDDLNKTITDLMKDSPRSQLAQLKFKKYAAKMGKELANGLKNVLIDLVSETAKKAIWG